MCVENRQILILVGILLTFLIPYHSEVSYSKSDPLGTLLTAQAMVEHQTVKLDAYTGNISVSYVGKLEKLPKGHGKYQNHNGHAYYAFPLGTSVFSMPFVWLARLQGGDMLDPANDEALQRILSSLACALAFLLTFAIARCFLSFLGSYVFSLMMILSTPLISTMGSALWSSVYAIILTLIVLLLLVRARFTGTHPNAWLLAPVLFSTFLCRPTLAVFVILVIGYIAFVHRPVVLRVSLLVMFQAMLLVMLSVLEFGQATPPYYQLARVAWLIYEPIGLPLLGALGVLVVAGWELRRRGKNRALLIGIYLVVLLSATIVFLSTPERTATRFPQGSITLRTLQAMNGSLFSPARGLFVYCPLTVFVVIAAMMKLKRMMREPLFWLMIIWMVAHLLMVSQPFWWHGGHCYGARLFAEVVPGIMLVALVAFKDVSLPKTSGRLLKAMIAVAAVFGAFVNSYQGLYNVQTATWNTSPNIDEHTEYLFSWRFPQFLASPSLNAAKEDDCRMRVEQTDKYQQLEVIADRLPVSSALSVGEYIATDCEKAVFQRFGNTVTKPVENPLPCGERGARVWFRFLPDQLEVEQASLQLDAAAVDTIRLSVLVNETSVDTLIIQGPDRRVYQTSFPSDYLKGNLVTSIEVCAAGSTSVGYDSSHSETHGDSLFWLWGFKIQPGS